MASLGRKGVEIGVNALCLCAAGVDDAIQDVHAITSRCRRTDHEADYKASLLLSG